MKRNRASYIRIIMHPCLCSIPHQVFGLASCQSSSFWYPMFQQGDIFVGEYYFLNETLRTTHLTDRPPGQVILIDAGDQEEHLYGQVD